MTTQEEMARWLALGRVKGLGLVSFKKLATRFADPTQAFSATPAELGEIDGLHRDAIEGLTGFSEWAEIESEIHRIREAGIAVVRFVD